MIQEVPTIEELIKQVVSYLQKVGYSDTRITQYRSAWQKLINYMSKHEIKVYNASVADSFTYSLLDGRKYDCISQWEKDVIMCDRLTEYLETGTVRFRRAKKFYELNGPIGRTMQDYLKTRREARISQETIDEISRALQSFLNYLTDNEICDVLEISKPILIDYTVFCNGYQTQYIRHRMLGILKGYLRYLYDIGSVSYDFSKALPRDKYTRQPKLPTTYSDTEIQRLLEVIDRGSPKGKRDYAMVLITARLGLRASDVCGLKFSSVIWEQNQIVLTMEKQENALNFHYSQKLAKQ